MKIKLISVLTALVLLSVTGQAAMLKEVPMKGNGSGAITGVTPGPNGLDIVTAGEGEATYLGRYTRREQILLDPVNGTLAGSLVFTAADGSLLYADVAGAFTGPNTVAGTYRFSGGTGRFENASGYAYFTVTQSNPVNFTFAFTGTIDLK